MKIVHSNTNLRNKSRPDTVATKNEQFINSVRPHITLNNRNKVRKSVDYHDQWTESPIKKYQALAARFKPLKSRVARS